MQETPSSHRYLCIDTPAHWL